MLQTTRQLQIQNTWYTSINFHSVTQTFHPPLLRYPTRLFSYNANNRFKLSNLKCKRKKNRMKLPLKTTKQKFLQEQSEAKNTIDNFSFIFSKQFNRNCKKKEKKNEEKKAKQSKNNNNKKKNVSFSSSSSSLFLQLSTKNICFCSLFLFPSNWQVKSFTSLTFWW